MRRYLAGMTLATVIAVAAFSPSAMAKSHCGLRAYGISDQQELVSFRASKPQHANVVGPISGLASHEQVVGIDFRPFTGELYALSSASKLYTVDTSTAVATLRSTLSVPLSGNAFGVDFNPTVDRLRIVSDTGQNLRVNVSTGAATVDTPLAYAATDPNAGVTPRVGGVAYTNNDNDEIVVAPNPPTAGTTGTTLYDIDAALDVLDTQAPPNAGTLNSVGSLGVKTRTTIGFDIYSRLSMGRAVSNTAFASLGRRGTEKLYSVDLATGAVRKLGSFGSVGIVDIALRPAQG